MKPIRLFISFLLLIISPNAFAQLSTRLYVHSGSNNIAVFNHDSILSIDYVNEFDTTFQVISTNDSIYRCPVVDIDSVTFSLDKNRLYLLSDEMLNGWDAGIVSGDYYVVVRQDTLDNHYDLMMNPLSSKEVGLCLSFDEEKHMTSVSTKDKYYQVIEKKDTLILLGLREDGAFEEYQIPVKYNGNNDGKILSRGISDNELVNCILDLIGTIGENSEGAVITTLINIIPDLAQADMASAIKDLSVAVIEGAICAVNLPVGVVVIIGYHTIAYLNERHWAEIRKAIYGDCTITIEKIEPDGQNAVVYASVKNAHTIPALLYFIDNEVGYKKPRNLVSCGIVGRLQYERVDYYLKDVASDEFKLYEQEEVADELHLQFYIKGANLKGPYTKYYFRPYLYSLAMFESLNGGNKTIKYGETVAYGGFPGEIGEVKQVESRCAYSEDNSEKEVTFRVHTAAYFELDKIKTWFDKLPGIGITECGVYYRNEDGLMTFNQCTPTKPIEGISMPGHQEAYIDISVLKSKFDRVDTQNFIASKKVKIGLYYTVEAGASKETVFGEPLEYELVYNTKPEIIITGGSILGTEILNTGTLYGQEYTNYEADFLIACDIKGALWLHNIDLSFSVTHCHHHFNDVSEISAINWKPITSVYDGEMELNFHWLYHDWGWVCDCGVYDKSYVGFIINAHTNASKEKDQIIKSKNYISFYGNIIKDNITVSSYD